MIVWLAALSAAQASVPIDCAAFAKRVDTPVAISTTPITPAEIGSDGPLPQAPGSSQTFAVGKLVYSSGGVTIRSTDQRFAQIEIGDSPTPIIAAAMRSMARPAGTPAIRISRLRRSNSGPSPPAR